MHTGSEISIWTAGFKHGDILLPESKHTPSDRYQGRPVSAVGNATSAVDKRQKEGDGAESEVIGPSMVRVASAKHNRVAVRL